MKKGIALLLCLVMILSGCKSTELYPYQDKDEVAFAKLSDAKMHHYVEQMVYTDLVEQLNSTEYFVENVSTVYISNE